jgi:hypothetical protein
MGINDLPEMGHQIVMEHIDEILVANLEMTHLIIHLICETVQVQTIEVMVSMITIQWLMLAQVLKQEL